MAGFAGKEVFITRGLFPDTWLMLPRGWGVGAITAALNGMGRPNDQVDIIDASLLQPAIRDCDSSLPPFPNCLLGIGDCLAEQARLGTRTRRHERNFGVNPAVGDVKGFVLHG